MDELGFSSAVRGKAVPDQAKRGKAQQSSTAEHIHTEGSGFREAQTLFVKSVDQANRRITALASTESIDRHGEVMLASAFKELLPVYMKNPVIITNHIHRLATGHSSVIGNVIKAWIDASGFWVCIEFIEGTELADEYWLLYSSKKQRGLSVGFIPMESRFEERDGERVLVHTKVELLEISVCAVPSNRETLSRAKQGKARFVADKKQEAADDKLWAKIVAENPDIEKTVSEFGDAILLGDYEGGEESGGGCDFAEAVTGKSSSTFADLVRG